MIRSVVFAVVVLTIMSVIVNVPNYNVKAEADCEKVGVHDNPAGNAAGNGHECVGGSGDNPEPVRDCSHKNSEKDNNDNGEMACIPRGASGGDDD